MPCTSPARFRLSAYTAYTMRILQESGFPVNPSRYFRSYEDLSWCIFTIAEPPYNLATAQKWAVRPVKYHTLTEYSREVTAPAVVFLPVSESSGGPLTLSLSIPSISLIPLH
ncbi:hypothetical protein EVAR_28243_1 [Eumeta japonica]|uniref:Uncharacterized protein n=1 Tax=Eumeta variegata TaxID=151549 RepID=A0A4C1V651_EUMVA|nr:hypothetical protein EVAR_28243_1 [Eumeta japonica]